MSGKKETKLGIDAKKSEDMSAWYTQVICFIISDDDLIVL
jgi:hypothetical protein